jgi:phosphoenolpyruvate-protein kinase (PTS system EI component)
MGADSLSMTPSSIPSAKKFIRELNRSSAKEILDTVLEMEDADTVTRYLRKYIPA